MIPGNYNLLPVLHQMTEMISDSELMLNFESIGDSCEFGLVQRKAGAEPLGLLRFSGVPVRHLIRALDHRFAGIAEPENVRVQLENGEYMVKLTKYDFIYHSFILEHQMDQTELHQREVRRINYLAREFIADLEAPTKILVFRQNEPLLAHDLALLSAALRRYATHTMLWVLAAQPGHPPGTVEIADDHLMLGYISWLAPRNDAHNFDHESWLKVLRAAYALWRSAESNESAVNTPLETAAVSAEPPKAEAPVGGANDGPYESRFETSAPDESVNREPGGAATVPAGDSPAIGAAPATAADGTDSHSRVLDGNEAETLASIHALLAAQRIEEAETLLEAAQLRFPAHAPFAIEAAQIAQRRGDLPEALRRWAVVQQRFPDEPMGYSGAATAHRGAGDFDQADAMLNWAQALFPDVPWLYFDYGWVAQIRRDWPEAVRRWELVRARSPDVSVGYTQGAIAMRELGWFDAAEALLQQAATRFPTDPQVRIEQGWLAQVRKDWASAACRWETVRATLPQEAVGYTAGARALRELGQMHEAGQLLQAAIARFPGRPEPCTEYAWLAQIQRNWPAAIERWSTVRAAFPALPDGYVQAARALAELSRHEEAEQVLTVGATRLPDAAEIAAERAWQAYRESRWAEAAERFAQLRERFPALPEGWLGGAMALRHQSLFQEADALLAAGMARLPDHPRIALEHALLPWSAVSNEDNDRSESLRRMEALRERFPSFEPGWLQGIRMLRESGQSETAEVVAQAGMAALPGNVALALAYASAALERADWPAAVDRFRVMAARFPDAPDGLVGVARALSNAGNQDAAEATLREAIDRFPNTPAPYAEFAEVSVRRRDWAEAARRWTAAEARFPREKVFSERLYEARLHVMESHAAADPSPAAGLRAQNDA